MNFEEIARKRQSCRAYDKERAVEEEKLFRILESARLSPSACNGQPYHITVCRGEAAACVAKAVQGMGLNKFAEDAPVQLVISERPYVAKAALGARIKKNDYRSIDIGILSTYITAEAEAQGLSTCILGWLDGKRIARLVGEKETVRLVISLGYARAGDPLREKRRRPLSELVTFLDTAACEDIKEEAEEGENA